MQDPLHHQHARPCATVFPVREAGDDVLCLHRLKPTSTTVYAAVFSVGPLRVIGGSWFDVVVTAKVPRCRGNV